MFRELSMGIQSASRSGMHPFLRSAGFTPLFALVLCFSAKAASLEPATVAAWDEYVRLATLSNGQRASSESGFLWVDEVPGRSARVREGEIAVAPTGRHSPTRVPDGLIHDWMGAVFIPGANQEDVLRALRDYSRYKDWFQPAVADSKLIESNGKKDRFSMVLVNKSFFKDSALDMEYESCFTRLDERRGYSISRSTRVQEVKENGPNGKYLLPEGEGSGMVWRLMTITRYLERDGGVYIELQAIGLSRDIPASLRWMVEPIVKHVLRASLTTSLRQTANAVLSNQAGKAPSVTESHFRGASSRATDRVTPQR